MLRQTYHVTQMDGAFSQHANPSGVLEFPQQLDDKQVADAKEKWKNEYGDMGKSGVAVLGGGL
ncbi:MAG: phage portal protein, partial [Oscillospiraceae bacterium]|nr:phage portal protein [Oscillospiraceae bacterium]